MRLRHDRDARPSMPRREQPRERGIVTQRDDTHPKANRRPPYPQLAMAMNAEHATLPVLISLGTESRKVTRLMPAPTESLLVLSSKGARTLASGLPRHRFTAPARLLLLGPALASLSLVACGGQKISTGATGRGGSSNGGSGSGAIVAAQSCAPGGPGMTDCGASGESCCATLEVPGGTFYRTYTSAPDGGATDEADPATVSSFRLDKYAVTVGRFRQFVKAWNGGSGFLPAEGSGKHTHLNGGLGLTNSAMPGTYEAGWDASDWNSGVALTDQNLIDSSPGSTCYPGDNPQGPHYSTWTSAAGSQENLPANCMTWYEAYAFCIWDGGFLPSEAEWQYAASGGSEQREYPWGSAEPGTACPGTGCEYAIYNCDYPSSSGTCTGISNIAPVGSLADGAGLWGQLDLAGNVWQWVLDGVPLDQYVSPCIDCTFWNEDSRNDTFIRGGNYTTPALNLSPPQWGYLPAWTRDSGVGIRCARTP
jgi:formylglycine-generating enzyme